MSGGDLAWLGLTAGVALSAAGFFLARRFRSPECEGEPRFQPSGPPLRPLVELAGKLLAVLGLCAAGLALTALIASGEPAAPADRHEVEASSAAASSRAGHAVEGRGGLSSGEQTKPPSGGGAAGGGGSASSPKAKPSAPKSSASKPAAAAPSASKGWDSGLSGKILERAGQTAREINRTGGYRFDGSNDCYGFVRRVWDPVLKGMGRATLPVSDAVSRQWAPIRSWSELKPGDVLATHQGHRWGAQWHGGLFWGMVSGKPYSYDNSPSNHGGAYPRPAPSGTFRYYYLPTHQLLTGK